MTLGELQGMLTAHGSCEVEFAFAAGGSIEPHFHVTEVGKVTKDFVDCGGTRRTTQTCVLQTYVANDIDHRLSAEKIASILDKASVLEISTDLSVEIEYQRETVGIFAVDSASVDNGRLVIQLGGKETACLAPDRCGLEILPQAGECGDTGCC